MSEYWNKFKPCRVRQPIIRKAASLSQLSLDMGRRQGALFEFDRCYTNVSRAIADEKIVASSAIRYSKRLRIKVYDKPWRRSTLQRQ